MNPTSIRIVKVGGSLFSWDDLATALQNWLERQSPMHNVLLSGSGEFANVVRSADARFDLGETASHWICIDLLHAASRLLASLMPDVKLVRQWASLKVSLEKCRVPGLFVLDPVDFLNEIEPSAVGEKLPATWATTSDSIAARVATNLEADELVLLKSVTPQTSETLEAISEQGLVDQFFPRAAATLRRIRVVNLRSPALDEITLHASQNSMSK